MPLTPEQVEQIAIEAASTAAERAARHSVEEAADKAAKKAAMTPEEIATVVRQTLLQMGVDSDNPLESQKDFQHLRQWRRAGEDLRSKGMLALMSIFVTGLVGLVIVGLKEYFK